MTTVFDGVMTLTGRFLGLYKRNSVFLATIFFGAFGFSVAYNQVRVYGSRSYRPQIMLSFMPRSRLPMLGGKTITKG